MNPNMLLAILLSTAAQAQSLPISVPRRGEPQATYEIVELRRDGPAHAVYVSRRTGPSGIYHTRRRANCRDSTYRRVAAGETLASMSTAAADQRDVEMVTGSSAQMTSLAACRALGM